MVNIWEKEQIWKKFIWGPISSALAFRDEEAGDWEQVFFGGGGASMWVVEYPLQKYQYWAILLSFQCQKKAIFIFLKLW